MEKPISNVRQTIRRSPGDVVFDVIIYIILTCVLAVVAYPLYFIIIASFSEPDFVNRGQVVFTIKGFTVSGYNRILQDAELWMSYLNTIIYTFSGTFLAVMTTMALAYPLSRKNFSGRSFLMIFLLITMYLNGGMIPNYLLVSSLGLRDTRTVLIVLGMLSVYNVIVARTFLEANISVDLEAAAAIDGCGQIRFFFQIVLPLSKAVISVLVLYYGVARWNDFMNALIYVDDVSKQPLALKLREILISTSASVSFDTQDPLEAEERLRIAESVKYGVMIVSTVPVLCLYPFLQKYFAKGAMIGSVKG